MTSVIHIRNADSNDVYIGRGSIWGNPFVIGRDGTRKECIEKYRRWAPTQPHLVAERVKLRGKRLACHCKPLPCHGDVLAIFAEDSPLVDSF